MRPTIFMAGWWAITIMSAAAAAAAASSDRPAPPVLRLTVYGTDRCPVGRGDEIVVCAREPESERYRIPKRFREAPRVDCGPGASWAARVEGLEAAQRFTMPGGCSPVGSNGQTGCTAAMLRQWYLARRQARAEAAATP